MKSLREQLFSFWKKSYSQHEVYTGMKYQIFMGITKSFVDLDRDFIILDLGCAEGLYTRWMSKKS